MNKELRSDTIKIIAFITMFIDHIGLGILERWYLQITDYDMAMRVYHISSALRAVGRIAFPIFCYQLVRGFFYTKNRLRYIRNLLVFAIISEVPFDLLEEGRINAESQNVIFTLLIGALLMLTLEWYKETAFYNKRKNLVLIYGIIVAIVVLYSKLALFIKSDYGAKGIVLITIIYFFKDDRTKLIQFGPFLYLIEIFVVMLLTNNFNMHITVTYCEFAAPAVVAFLFMYMDNGERRYGKWFKWFGYWFYPVHMMFLFFIAKILKLA